MNHTRYKFLIVAFLGLGVLARADLASAEQVRYVGVHPIPVAEGQSEAFCHIEFPHVHVYKPAEKNRKDLYRVEGGEYHFVGDPVAFGYDGPKYSYYGHHPVRVDPSVHVDVDLSAFDDEYCYINGPHYHGYQPAASAQFELQGDAYWYVGKYPKAYGKHKKERERINAVYAPMVYERPVVVVDARPVAYVGPIVEVHTPAVIVDTPAVIVEEPHGHVGVEVVVPAPAVHLDIGVGHSHRHVKYKKHRKYRKFRKHGKHKH